MGFHTKAQTILLVKNRAIGDTILMTGPIRLLRQHLPDHQIHVLVRSPAGQLLEGLPYIDRIISAAEPKPKLDRLAYWMRMLHRLRERQYEFVLNFHASFRTALFSKFLRTEQCVVNHHELNRRNWFSDLAVPGRGKVKSIIDRDLDLLRAIGISVQAEDAMPEVRLSPIEKEEAAKLFEGAPACTGPRVFLGIGGSRETKRWPAEHFFDLSQRLVKELDALLVMADIPSDEHWLRGFWRLVDSSSHLKQRILYFRNLPLRRVAGIISECRAYVGNDSGLKHLAAALGLPTFTFFGPEIPLEWHPYSLDRHPYAFLPDLACRTETGKHWCAVSICNHHQHRCMKEISLEKAWPEIVRILQC